MKVLIILIAIIGAVFVLGMLNDAHRWNSLTPEQRQVEIKTQVDVNNADKRDHAEAAAVTVCKDFVSKRLKAPGTASFQWAGEMKTENLSQGQYRVASYVDSQNSFGATLRTNFTCTVHTPNGVDFNLDQLQLK